MSEHCNDCGMQAPVTDTNYTLIDAGWRVTKTTTGSAGGFVMEWHCPACWKARKNARDGDDEPASR